jgi:hypothetical protein
MLKFGIVDASRIITENCILTFIKMAISSESWAEFLEENLNIDSISEDNDYFIY